ncbi:hypothetical protein C8R47DRAFT_806608 [Mycena vitilis]|nr:hypothetical protein C8R47DRAFT_806608 [Mycena vitilis]
MTLSISHPVFPPEITDLIIHELAADTPVLRICSSVSRSWLPASRCLLHETLSLHGENIGVFLKIIASAENTYLPTLRAMDLSLASCEKGTAASLLQLLPHFLRLKSIRIHSGLLDCDLPVVPRVTMLQFCDIRFGSFLAFRTLMTRGQFPALRKLKLEDVSFVETGVPAPVDVAPKVAPANFTRQRLEAFFVKIGANDAILVDWLCSQDTGPVASDLVLHFPKEKEEGSTSPAKVFMYYLRHLNIALKRLHICFGSNYQIGRIDLGTNTSLKSVHIDLLRSRTWTRFQTKRHMKLPRRYSQEFKVYIGSGADPVWWGRTFAS